MPFLLAGLSSLTFGVADFLGGMASRRAPVVSVVLLSQLVAGAGIVVVAPLVAAVPQASDFGWGAAAGVAGTFGLVVFYRALSTTRIGVAAPVTALFGTVTPVVFGFWDGERPALLAWLGIAFAVVAIVLVTRPPSEVLADRTGDANAVLLGSVAGVGFGLFGVLISRTSDTSGVWPLVGARATSVTLLLIAVVVMRHPVVRIQGRGLAVGAGSLDMIANIFFLVAIRQELLSLVAVIMAMYPASTISLARIVLHERIGRAQAAGFGLGAIGMTLIVIG
jgi:drug/metabolite transporter (DMT)-like permease